jgi:hypothetical protein
MRLKPMKAAQRMVLSMLVLVGLQGLAPGQPEERPLSIRRLEVAPTALGSEMRRERALVSMPRAQFEELVRKAELFTAAEKRPPLLLEAQYQAHLDGEALVGTAEWTLHNPAAVPSVFRLQPWNLALQSRPELDGKPAVLGEIASSALGLMLPVSGQSSLRLKWSARAEVRPEGLWYYLQLPSAPVAVLDLETALDQEVDCPGHKPMVVPGHADGQTKRWRLTFGGLQPADLEVLVRPARAPSKPGLLWAAAVTTCTLTRAGCETRFLVDLQGAHQRLTAIRLELDNPLEVEEIGALLPTATQLAWRTPDPTNRRTVLIAFAEPVERQVTLEVRCRADNLVREVSGTRLRLPGLRVAGALMTRERLQVRLGQGLRLVDWDLSDFRLEEAPITEREAGESFETFRLVQTGLAGPPALRPTARLLPAMGELTSQQEAWWQLDTESSTLTVLNSWQVRSGRVFRLPLSIPVGWQVQEAEVLDSEQAVTWRAENGPTLVADFREPLGPGAVATTKIRLRSAAPGTAAAQRTSQALPSVRPAAGVLLESRLAVSLPRALDRQPMASQPMSARFRDLMGQHQPPPGAAGHLWAAEPTLPDLYCRNRGGAIQGFLDLEPAPPAPRIGAPATVGAPEYVPGAARVEPVPAAEASTLTLWISKSGVQTAFFKSLVRSPGFGVAVLDMPANAHSHSVKVNGALLPQSAAANSVPLTPGLNDVEVTYSEHTLPWHLGAVRRANFPQWRSPVLPVEPRCIITLPPGVGLLGVGEVSRLQEPLIAGSKASILRSSTRAFDYRISSRSGEPDTESGARMLQRALAAWDQRAASEPEAALGMTLLSLERDAGEPGCAFVLDAVGLAERGVSLERPVTGAGPEPPWDTLGLVVIPCRHGLLLTTSERLVRWGLSSALEAETALNYSVEEAIMTGHDATGQFQTLMEALHGRPGGWGVEAPLHPWISFEVSSGGDGADFVLLDRLVVHLVGVGTVLLLVTIGWRFSANRQALGIGLFLSGCLAVVWLPVALQALGWWLLVAAGILGLAGRMTQSGLCRRPLRSVARTGVASLLVAAAASADAQPPVEGAPKPGDVVYILRDSQGAAGDAEVLAPRDLLARLQDLAGRSTIGLPAYVLVDADYSGRLLGDTVRLQATYLVEIFEDRPVDVELRLGNLRLVQALLDGAPAPVSPLGPEGGLKVRIQGRGSHAIVLTGESSLHTVTGEHELTCRIPFVASNRLTLKLPTRPKAIRLSGARGGRWLQSSEQEVVLVADLGATTEMQVRWQSSPSQERALSAREVYLLELGADEVTLRGAVSFEVSRGTIQQLRLSVPAMLEVKTLEIRGDPAQESAPRLRDWRVERNGEAGILVVELARPLAGQMRLLLEFAVHPGVATNANEWLKLGVLPLGFPALLPTGLALADVEWAARSQRTMRVTLPAPLDASRQETLWACRLDEVDLDQVAASRGLVPTDEWQAFRRAWPTGFGNPDRVDRVFAGRNLAAAQLAFRVTPAAAKVSVMQTLRLQPESGGAALRGKVELQVDSGSLGLLRIEVPPGLELAEVVGPDVRHWDRRGRHLEVWLKRLIADRTTLQCTGWLPAAVDPAGAERLTLPRLRWPGVRTARTTIDIDPQTGVTVEPEQLEGLTPVTGQGALTLVANQPGYRGSLRIRPAQALGPLAPSAKRDATSQRDQRPATIPDCRVVGVVRSTRLAAEGVQQDAAEIFVIHEREATLKVPLSAGIQIQEVRCDDEVLSNCLLIEGTLRVPLPPRRGGSQVQIRWRRPIARQGEVSLDGVRPEFAGPAVVCWKVELPAEARFSPRGSLQRGRAAASAHALSQAEMNLKLVEALLPPAREQLAPATEECLLRRETAFFRHMMVAAEYLRAGADVAPALSKKLRALDRDHQRLLADERWQQLRRRAEKAASASGAWPGDQSGCGNPSGGELYYQTATQNPPVLALTLHSRKQQEQTALLLSVVVMGIAAVLLLLLRLLSGRSLVSAAWPEIIAGFGLAAYLLELGEIGPVALMVLGLTGRALLLLARWLQLPAFSRSNSEGDARQPVPSTVIRGAARRFEGGSV